MKVSALMKIIEWVESAENCIRGVRSGTEFGGIAVCEIRNGLQATLGLTSEELLDINKVQYVLNEIDIELRLAESRVLGENHG